jgi:hypothetical protein
MKKAFWNAVPAGDYNKPILDAYEQALDAILSKGLKPVAEIRTALAE